MKNLVIILVFFVLVVDVSATATNVTVINDDVYTGAILKLRNLGSESLGDSYYPFFVGRNIGIIKFEVETGLSKANLNLRFIKSGEISFSTERGPFTIDGSEIIIDLREIASINDSERETVEVEKTENITEEIIIQEDAPSLDNNTIQINKKGLVGHTLKDIFFEKSNYVLIGFGILFTGFFLFFIVRSAYKSGAKAELRELGRMELDRKIDRLKD
ncbi:MAG: hypothetical protein U9Q73_00260 [Nanoarchaeota archaeon]|nr:hypothetical protein [Nanoarchaeota archaeon]